MIAPEEGMVFIVDDDDAVRDGMLLLMTAVGYAARGFASGAEFLETTLPEDGPACLLLDLKMPGMSGMEVQEHLQERGSDLPIVFLTAHGDIPLAVRAVQRGALAFLEKPRFSREELIGHVRTGLDHHRRRLAARVREAHIDERIGALSRRELEVARRVAAGNANKVIALEFGISERTVEIHRSRAMKKLGLRTVADLVRLEDRLDRQLRLF